MKINRRQKTKFSLIVVALLAASSILVANYSNFLFKADTGLPLGDTQVANLANNGADYTGSSVDNPQIPKYDKFELTFDINRLDAPNGNVLHNIQEEIDANTINPYWPYDPNPAANTQANIDSRGDGTMPVEPGKGISVDGLFSNDNWTTTITQPGFYYQDYDYVKRIGQYDKPFDWLYPKGNPVWKISFAPTEEGDWTYKIRIRDTSGQTEYTTNGNFASASSQNHGFVKASNKDPRYFETSDGKYLQLTGLNDNTGFGDLENRYKDLNSMGVNLLRPWWQASQGPAVFGISGQGGSKNWWMVYPNQDIWTFYTDIATGNGKVQPGHLFSMPIDGSKGSGTFATDAYVKPNTKYKLSGWVKTENLTGTGDFGAYLGCSNCLETGPLNTKFKGTDWTELSATIASGNGSDYNSYFMHLSLTADNTTGGTTYLSGLSLKEVNADNSLGPELISKPNYDVEQYVSPDQSWIADYSINKAKENDIYLKPVIEEKGDVVYQRIGANGLGTTNADESNFFGGDTSANRTYQEYFWRYMIARYSSNTALHSFELCNEASPSWDAHWNASAAFGKYMNTYDPNRHLASTSNWHSFPAQLWRNSNVSYADYHESVLRSYLWPGWEGNWAYTEYKDRKQLTLGENFSFDSSTSHSGKYSLKMTASPNIDPNTGQLNTDHPVATASGSTLAAVSGIEPGHKMEISAWVKADNLAYYPNQNWQVLGINATAQTSEGQWSGWITGSGVSLKVPESGVGQNYDWKKISIQFYAPSYYGVATDKDGNVYALNAGPINNGPNYSIIKFDPNGDGKTVSKTLPIGSGLKNLVFDNNNDYYFPDLGNNEIWKADETHLWPPLNRWGNAGSGDGQFNNPSGIALDSSGNIYVADTGNNRIQKLNSSGGFVAKWGTQGSSNGQFNNPYGIAIDSGNNIYVNDSGNNRIEKFNSNGDFLAKWGSGGSGDGQFNNPSSLALDSDGNIYIADTGNNRVQKLNSNGQFIKSWGGYGTDAGQFKYPLGITVDKNNNVYVADTGNIRLQRFNQNGDFQKIYYDTNNAGSGAYDITYSFNNLATNSSNPGHVWFDDIEIKDLNNGKVLNYNGGFEDTNRASYDIVAGYLAYSRRINSYQLGKPATIGEGYIVAPQRFGNNFKPGSWDGDQLLAYDPDGIWWKKLNWASVDGTGVVDIRWGQRDMLYNNKYTYTRSLQNFMSNIDLSNGKYQYADSTTSNPDIRVLGQKEVTDGKADKAHIWIDNRNYTWKAIADHNFNLTDITWSTTDTYPASTTAYYNGNIYKSLQNGNQNHSVSNSSWWQTISMGDFLALNDMSSLNPPLPSPISGTITVPGMKENETFDLQWWDTSEGDPTKQIINTTKAVSDASGNINIPISNLVSDVALKITVSTVTALEKPTASSLPHPSTYKEIYHLTGTKSASVTQVLINNIEASVDNTANTWAGDITLSTGDNTISVVGKDDSGNSSEPTIVNLNRHKPADANGDGSIDISDFAKLVVTWNKDVNTSDNYLADFNEDGSVDVSDFAALLGNWKK